MIITVKGIWLLAIQRLCEWLIEREIRSVDAHIAMLQEDMKRNIETQRYLARQRIQLLCERNKV